MGTGIFYLIFADGKIQRWNNPNAAVVYTNGGNLSQVEAEKQKDENFI